ncbi:phosphate ABC transporter substrate-binding protein PstS [Subtercola boreus]|uniref:Phosphate ABC transporter substrate-binding protein PstS n=1 Tax=Subtercola boreus TaxID=120213 RepID=A0A3E0VTC5_9MICO|nr:phosphate ABC transporter substrate-binding protein PstS [Subtercola boreus]RFA12875.1 phosphate ABC transporter substrate-binding protein PstS [Subtercola boreus]
MTPRARFLRFLTATLALVVLLLGVGGGVSVQSASAEIYLPITGSGSTWSQNALDQWRKNVAANYGMTVNYSGNGSSAGRQDFISQSVDFAVSEIPFQAHPEDNSAPEVPTSDYAYMPIVAGGTSFMYNLKIGGKRVTNLRLDGDVITKIFTGVIVNWNDPAIVADNPGLAMPDKAIVPVLRSDGSGSTAQFTLWMSKQHSDLWNSFCTSVGRSTPCGLTSQYPGFGNAKLQSGSLGVAGYVSQDYGEGAITYVEYSYALKSGFPVAKVLNNAGYFVEPTAPSVAVALVGAQINSDLTQVLDGVYNNTDPRTYPLSSYSYMILPTQTNKIFTAEKGKTLGAFTSYLLCEGQQQAQQLGYSPLPLNLVQAASDQVKRIPGGPAGGVDLAKCNNPALKILDTAPQPVDCDKQGPNQCTTGTAGAIIDTPVTGSGSGGSAAAAPTADGGAAAAAPAADAAAAAAAAASAADPAAASAAGAAASNTAVYDANGAVVSGSAAAGASVAVSKPLTLADQAFGPQQIVMISAGVLLLLAIVLPPFVSRRLKRSR